MKVFKNGVININTLEELNSITNNAQWGICRDTYNFNWKLGDKQIDEPVMIYNGVMYNLNMIDWARKKLENNKKASISSIFHTEGSKGLRVNKEMVLKILEKQK